MEVVFDESDGVFVEDSLVRGEPLTYVLIDCVGGSPSFLSRKACEDNGVCQVDQCVGDVLIISDCTRAEPFVSIGEEEVGVVS